MAATQESIVYAIGSTEHALIKIGTTANLPARLAALQTSSPFRLQILWQHEGGRELERHLHAVLGERRLHGEWFDFGGTDAIALISEAAARPMLQPVRQPATVAVQPRAGLPEDSTLGILLAELKAVEDPAERGALATETLDYIAKTLNPELSALRRQIGARLRADGLTYREIAEVFDVSPGRIPQILKGEPTGRWANAARKSAAKDESGRPADTA